MAASPTAESTTLWISPAVPPALRESVVEASRLLPGPITIVELREPASLRLEPGDGASVAEWTYAAVAPFPTIRDSITLAELRDGWQGRGESPVSLFVSPSARDAMREVLGEPAETVKVVPSAEDLLEAAWAARPALAIVPFEGLDPRWKVLEVDGVSPVRKDFDPAGYPLRMSFDLTGDGSEDEAFRRGLEDASGQTSPIRNRRADRLTTVVMTGVTALTRATAWQMDRSGATFPSKDIGDWLRQADLTHISNEVAFSPDCPDPVPDQTPLLFCSSPRHLALLEDVGTDVVELTGNHVLDAGPQALLYTLDLFRQAGWRWFGGGANLAEAVQPVLVEHNGNRIAFLGCNEAGPVSAWATEDRPGANPCGSDRLQAQAKELRAEGYLPIVTFQWHEHYTPAPPASQREAFEAAAAGAVAVSGSQAHQPQGFGFQDGAFIHYGLGNLFFDQMWSEAVRKEFVDRYVFHDGRLISVELLTAYLEDWSRPRPMTPEERASFLEEIFRASGW